METRKILVIFFFLGLCAGLFAQNKGVVYGGKTIQRLEGVNICLHKDTVGIGITDKEGEFDIEPLHALTEEDTLTFSYVGYETLNISLEKLKKKNYLVILADKVQQLGEVSITGSSLQEYLHWEPETTIPHSKGLFAYASVLVENKIYIIGGDESQLYLSLIHI